MKKINVELENCYGIKLFRHTFDFTDNSVYAVYAPNGVMKTSLAKTFTDLSQGELSKDIIFPNRKTVRNITDENGKRIEKENIFVIEPYNESFDSSKANTLLVNAQLKTKYTEIIESIEKKKEKLVQGLKSLSGLRKKTESTFAVDFTFSEKKFYQSTIRIKQEVKEDDLSNLDSLVYNKIFNEKVEKFLKQPNIREKLKSYVDKYNELIKSSKYFRKGIFSHNNATTIAKNLKDNGFFQANHSINLWGGGTKQEITTMLDLEALIKEEKESILNNETLQGAFNEIDSELNKNKDLKAFRTYLLENTVLLTELDNIPLLKQKLWISYTQSNIDLYNDLIQEYEKGKNEIEKIIKKAKEEETTWRKVVNIFNYRFSVPFKINVENQENVILNSEAPKITFEFEDTKGRVPIDKTELQSALSGGELRALYILNVIFEVEARKSTLTDTIFIVDDIADSFDYKNKYAIIEYLNDMSKEPYFFQIILSHNFDFFRTISGRLQLARKCKLNTIKTPDEVKLIEEKYQNNDKFIEVVERKRRFFPREKRCNFENENKQTTKNSKGRRINIFGNREKAICQTA